MTIEYLLWLLVVVCNTVLFLVAFLMTCLIGLGRGRYLGVLGLVLAAVVYALLVFFASGWLMQEPMRLPEVSPVPYPSPTFRPSPYPSQDLDPATT